MKVKMQVQVQVRRLASLVCMREGSSQRGRKGKLAVVRLVPLVRWVRVVVVVVVVVAVVVWPVCHLR
jgi:hypothetical protein